MPRPLSLVKLATTISVSSPTMVSHFFLMTVSRSSSRLASKFSSMNISFVSGFVSKISLAAVVTDSLSGSICI